MAARATSREFFTFAIHIGNLLRIGNVGLRRLRKVRPFLPGCWWSFASPRLFVRRNPHEKQCKTTRKILLMSLRYCFDQPWS